jgi:cysteinyl-tRNA synthetase
LKIFICGPTLYERCHIGHARIFIFFNFLINFHRFIGDWPIAILQLTDIDHKIYQKDYPNSINIANISDKFLSFLFEDLNNIQVEKNFIYSRVSNFLSLIKSDVIGILNSKKGYMYAGNVYLKITEDIISPFGLDLNDIDNMPIDISCGKSTQRDIMIWNSENFYQEYKKKDDEGNNEIYKKILTSGIPGWHFQDHEIIKNVFNGDYDIHGGARELLYPHHEFIDESSKKISENSKMLYKKKWLHIGLVNINSEKMSNSTGNTVSISNILKTYNPNTLKLYFLSKNYKTDIEFSNQALDKANENDKNITSFLLEDKNCFHPNENIDKPIIKRFLSFLYDDYDTASALELILQVLDKTRNSLLIGRMLEILGLKYY